MASSSPLPDHKRGDYHLSQRYVHAPIWMVGPRQPYGTASSLRVVRYAGARGMGFAPSVAMAALEAAAATSEHQGIRVEWDGVAGFHEYIPGPCYHPY